MSRVDELITYYSSKKETPWMTLAQIATRRKGFYVTAKTINEQIDNENGILVFGAGSTKAFFNPSQVPEQNIIRDECVIVKSRGYIDFEYCKIPCAHKSELWSYIPDKSLIIPKFLYYFLKTIKGKLQTLARATSVKIPQLSVGDTDSLKIPIPPLPVQDEIVRILDSFTQLEAELEAELEARRKQYEYYRDSLIEYSDSQLYGGKEFNSYQALELESLTTKPNKINWTYQEGKDISYIDLSSVDVTTGVISETPLISSQNAPSRAQQIVHQNDILFGTTRPLQGRVTIVPKKLDEAVCSTGFCVLRLTDERVYPHFLYHYLKSRSFTNFVELNQSGANYPSISDKKVKSFVLPVPPLSEQQRIVSILDKFDALVNDISVGLPAEIAARRKQYEHYRDQLLNFEEAK